jgi:3-hydroxy acid dehydrogenase / malonic semialdehyde reductase
MNRIVLITGATSGFGLAAAQLLAENNFNLIVTGRRKERLEQLKIEIESRGDAKLHILCFDIRNQKQTKKAIESLPDEWKNISVLINNAGLAAGFNHIQDGDLDDWERMIDTNIKGLLYISREVIPLMIANKSGHIVNISSIAGHEVYEKGNVYCASKHAVEALGKAMRIDLVKDNIKVTTIAPGMAETEFSLVRFHGNAEAAKKVYDGFVPLRAEDIADAILYAITRPAHVCINEMLIMPTAQASAVVVDRK